MKIILSRKGFDTGYGGVPSPILHDQSLLSLPIPYDIRETRRRFEDVQWNGESIGPLVKTLTRAKILQNHFCYLAPICVLMPSANAHLAGVPSLGNVMRPPNTFTINA
jgi:hypothetical protein